jgi:HEAT repeat protein
MDRSAPDVERWPLGGASDTLRRLRSLDMFSLHSRAAALTLPFWLAVGCDTPVPKFVSKRDVDQAAARGAWPTVCRGLEMKQDETREAAAEKLEDMAIAAEDVACLCPKVKHEKDGWDEAIVKGIRKTKRDELASCFGELVKDPQLPRRAEAVDYMLSMKAKAAREALSAVAQGPGEAKVRAAAVGGIVNQDEYKSVLLKLAEDPEGAVRAAAALGLAEFKDDAAVVALWQKMAREDSEGAARGAALAALKQAGVPEAEQLLCSAMLEDKAPEVRAHAVGALRGTKSESAIDCLRKLALKNEESGAVREQLLATLKSSPNQKAADVLCDAMPFWVRTYITDFHENLQGVDIIKAHNDRDFERSFECIGKARGSASTCYAKRYTGWWFNEVGGKSAVPDCPKKG